MCGVWQPILLPAYQTVGWLAGWLPCLGSHTSPNPQEDNQRLINYDHLRSVLLRPLVHLLLHELDRSENIGHFNSSGNRAIERQGPPPANTKAESVCAYAGRFAATDILRNPQHSSSERTNDLVFGRGFLNIGLYLLVKSLVRRMATVSPSLSF
jgi:hypothetical protein